MPKLPALFARKGAALGPTDSRGAFLLRKFAENQPVNRPLISRKRIRSSVCGLAAPLLACLCVAALSARAEALQSPAAPPSEAASAFLEVNDETGRHVRVPQPVRRIISLAPSLTETVFALGAGDKLAADTDYCDYPPEAVNKPKVGGTINPSIEAIVALHPDVVLATKSINRRETVLALERLGIATYATDPRTVEEVLASVERLGTIIGARDAGAPLVASLKERLEALRQRLRGLATRRVLFIVWLDPLISVGKDTFLADALRRAGAESVVRSSQDWPQISLEEIVRLQPEYLVFANAHAESALKDFQSLAELPGWRNLDAVQNKRVAIVSDAVDRPAPRLVDAIEDLARQLHPEAFTETPGSTKEKPEARPPAPGPEKPPHRNLGQDLGLAEGESSCAL